MERRWRYEMTRERIPELQLQLDWALQRQNQRFARAMPTTRMSHAKRRNLGLVVAGLGLACLAALYALDPVRFRHHGALFGGCAAVFVIGGVAAMFTSRIHAWGRRAAGTMLARRSTRMMRPVAARAPYTIEYALLDGRLEARVDKLALRKQLALRTVKLALITPGAIFLFRRVHALVPARMIYVPDETERRAVEAELAALGIACEAVTGSSDGYVAPIPEARVHS